MKNIIYLYFLLFISCANAQNMQNDNLIGTWEGTLDIPNTSLGIVFHLSYKDGVWTSTMDSPNQGQYDLETDATSFDGKTLIIEASKFSAKFEGTYDEAKGIIEGAWSQRGQAINLNLTKKASTGETVIKEEEKQWIGSWKGALEVQNMRLALIFHISKEGTSWKTTMDSPHQNQYGFLANETSIKENIIQIKLDGLNAAYEGTYDAASGQLKGSWKQAGQTFPLDLKNDDSPAFNRPQTPQAPFPYTEEVITFENPKAAIQLEGTLTLPEGDGPFPVAILVSGSGPQNRDEEILGHKPFWVIADYLTREGIAVFRYDDRGVGNSKGDHAKAHTGDLATDAEAAFLHLKTHPKIDKSKIGIIGHSEGGMIAPMVASKNKDLAFIISLAGPGVPMKDLLVQQGRDIASLNGTDPALLDRSMAIFDKVYTLIANDKKGDLNFNTLFQEIKPDYDNFTKEEKEAIGLSEQIMIQQINVVLSPWFRYALTFDPQKYWKKVKCPVLALNGDKDIQVKSTDNIQAIKAAATKSKSLETKQYPNLNHLFQNCDTGKVQEYSEIEETLSEEVLKDMSDWLKSFLL